MRCWPTRRAVFTLAVLAIFAVPLDATALEVTFQVTVPANTPPGDDVFLAGNFQGWDPGSQAHRLTRRSDGVHEITLDFAAQTNLRFKFTRGDWSRVEKGPSGEEIDDRAFTVTDAATLELTVASWADLPGNSTVRGNVRQTTVPGFLDGRRVWIYLPPGYDDDPQARYPVLYMMDGQNVFDAATSFAGEWQVDEACEDLIGRDAIRPLIVVAVDNGGGDRIQEYTPWPAPGFGGGGGDVHLAAWVDVLVPWVDASYRTRDMPSERAISGSSLGGLMSVFAAYVHPDVFGLSAALSPSIWWSNDRLLTWVSQQARPQVRAYLDMGTRETGSLVDENANGIDDSIDDLRALRDVMQSQGFVLGEDLRVVEDEGAQHQETFWAARFPAVLEYLFPRTSIPLEKTSFGALKRRFE